MEENNIKKDIPGAFLNKPFEAATVPELKRWLKCRKASMKGLKSELVNRYVAAASFRGQRSSIHLL